VVFVLTCDLFPPLSLHYRENRCRGLPRVPSRPATTAYGVGPVGQLGRIDHEEPDRGRSMLA